MSEQIDPGDLSNDDSIRTIVERRMLQIMEALGLDADHFKRRHLAAQAASDGSHDIVMSKDIARLAEVLPQLEDPFLRAQILELADVLVKKPH